MGTRSYIALQIEEDEYLTIFCHYNGYPDDNVREEAVKAMDRTRLQDFRKLLNNLFESGKCYRIEEAMEHINFAKAEISLWMIIDEVPDGRIKKCTQLSMITIEARHLLLQKK